MVSKYLLTVAVVLLASSCLVKSNSIGIPSQDSNSISEASQVNRTAPRTGSSGFSNNGITSSAEKEEIDRAESKFSNIINVLHYLNPTALSRQLHDALKGKASWLTCELCSTAIGMIRLYPSVYTTQTIFVEMCSTLGYEERKVCSGLSELFGEEFVYILSHSNLTHSEICGLVISPSCSTLENYPHGLKWMMPLERLNTSLQVRLNSHRTMNRLISGRSMVTGNKSTILHLSDIHLDLYYQVNAYAACSEPLCCRAGSTKASNSHPAGFWGSFGNCDSALRTVQSLISTIAQDHSDQYRYLLFTGDYIAHDVWNTTKAEIITTTRRLNTLFRANIPADKVVVPVIGNHEGYPVNQFCPPELGIQRFSAQWLYDELLDQWKGWIPEDYHETFRKNGYYAKADGKVRIIVLNMNYCARLNFWVAYDYLDLGGMLKWLQMELQKALANDQYVYIAGHIVPDAEECATHWVQTYNDIIEKYADIIKGQFFGHTHMDELRLYYAARNSSKAVGVAYVTPSVTTFCDVNPAFRLYNTDPSTGTIVDHRTYYLNLTEANLQHTLASPFFTPEPKWNFEYSAREAYNMSSLGPQEWHRVMSTINENKKNLHQYYRYYGRYDSAQVNEKGDAAMLSLVQDRVFVRF